MLLRESLYGTWQPLHAEDNPDYYCGPQLRGRLPLQAQVPEPVHRTLLGLGHLLDVQRLTARKGTSRA